MVMGNRDSKKGVSSDEESRVINLIEKKKLGDRRNKRAAKLVRHSLLQNISFKADNRQ
jgi:hypothetical protein